MTAAAPVFNQVAPLPLYALSSAGDVGVAGYWAGYSPSATASLGSQATLDQVWQDAGGVYLFLAEAPAELAAFAAQLQRALPQLSPRGTLRVLWIANPGDPWEGWQTWRLDAVAAGEGETIAWRVAQQGLFELGGYLLTVQPGTALEQADPDALGPGLAFAEGALTFSAPGGAWPARGAWLPLAGAGLGALQGTLTLPPGSAGAGVPDDLARLGVMLRYAAPVPDSPTGEVAALDMPVLRQNGAALTLRLGFDPLNPQRADRSALGFFPAAGSGPIPALQAAFVTVRGHGTTLTPVEAPAPLWPARLAFCRTPLFVADDPDAASYAYHLAPDGAFALALAEPGSGGARLMLGTSGLESVGLPDAAGVLAFFVAGRPAFVPAAPTARELLSPLGTTAHLTVLPAGAGADGLPYFAQPRQASLFADRGVLGEGFLDFLEQRAAVLPGYGPLDTEPPAVLPVGAPAWIDPARAPLALELETRALAPARRAALAPPAAAPRAPTPRDEAETTAVTPQGFTVVHSADGQDWTGVVLAQLPASRYPRVALTEVGPPLRAALQSSQVFFVVSNVDTFMAASSVAYRLDPGNLPLLAGAGVPAAVITALDGSLGSLDPAYPVFPNEAAFVAQIQPVAGDFVPRILPIAGLLQADLEGWTFQLSPRAWRADPASPTLMVFKFCDRSLVEQVADPASWGWPEAATGRPEEGIEPTRRVLAALLADAGDAPAGSPLRRFYDEVANNRGWNGVLFLNAPVATAELPTDLLFLSAGLDRSLFYAHHLGFSMTPLPAAGGAGPPAQTAAFGLIAYQDPVDLYADSTVPFAFKTLGLTARFANAALADFSAQVELLLNRLFGAELTRQNADHGNNLVLDGSYQRVNGAASYAFSARGQNVYLVEVAALDSIEVLGVQLQTRQAPDAQGDLQTRFILAGNLRFFGFQPFDLFSYGAPPDEGALRFGNLIVTMTFNLADPAIQSFTVSEGQLNFDLAHSHARPDSLAARFPLTLTGLLAVPEGTPDNSTPEDFGYASVAAPIEQVPLAPPWYGLTYTLDLGTLGALAGSAGFSVNVLAAWAPRATGGERPVYVGLQLPSARALGINLPLQGVLRLGFRGVQFETYEDDGHGRGYLLRLRRLALSVLGLSFPPGNADVLLFGDPDSAGRSKLGWYAAYTSSGTG